MYLRRVLILIILFSIIGISATFMPWMHFPRTNSVLYGYVADGVPTGIAFFIILLLAVYAYYKKSVSKLSYAVMACMGLLLAYTALAKINAMEYEQLNFSTDHAILGAALAGTHLGIGIYVYGLSGLGIFIAVLSAILLPKFLPSLGNEANNSGFSRINFRYIIPMFLVIAGLVGYYFYFGQSNLEINANTIRPTISADVVKMGKALAEGDYNTFVDYNHLIMRQSLGGRDKLFDLVQSTMEGLKESGTSIRDITLSDIQDVARDGKSVQAVITQGVTFVQEGGSKTESQKMIAVSEDVGATWHYINISKKTKAEMLKIFPSLNQDLEF